ncbi:MAG: fibronectin type III domain-containing protein [Chitinophagales bacterium]|nr:fibronectin type III domain-containing protein [Chitinophagales bacterium]
MKNVRIVLSIYTRIAVANFINAVQAIIGALTGNPNFPTPNPSLASIQDELDVLRSQQSLVDQGNLSMVPARNQTRDTIMSQIFLLSNYVQYQANSTSADAEEAAVKIQSANFVVSGERNPIGILPGVTNLRSKNLSQAVELEWKSLYGAHAYSVMMTIQNPNDPQAVWTEVALCTRSKVTVTDLTPGQAVAFRIYALGSAGKGQPSDIVTAMAVL